MGHPHKRKRGQWNKGKSLGESGGKSAPSVKRPKAWETKTWVLENANFEAYYKAQDIVPAGEWDDFLTTMRKKLPTNFRVSSCSVRRQIVLDRIQKEFAPAMQGLEIDGEKINPPRSLPWYPGGLGFQFDLDRKTLRKSKVLNDFQSFLVKETSQGDISRQEAVSMIPPLFLDVQPHHRVLDMCAAPGSKTAQLIEMVHANGLDSNPSGCVVANDADTARVKMLVHQLKRLHSPAVMVINHDARSLTTFPLSGPNIPEKFLRFDRILADVPCSGDGTMRKAPDIWENWKCANGNALHRVQLDILLKGIQLLAPGGRLVYSTCTMNPIEDEAVIAEALRQHPNDIDIVDMSDMLPNLKRLEGVLDWKVAVDNEGELKFLNKEDKFEEITKAKIVESMFPSADPDPRLKRCMRVLPQQQDTGAFFITVIEKKLDATEQLSKAEKMAERYAIYKQNKSSEASSFDAESGEVTATDQVGNATADGEGASGEPRKRPDRFFRELKDYELRPVQGEHEHFLDDISSFFGMERSVASTHLLASSEDCRGIYLVNPVLHALMASQHNPKPHVFWAGIRAFERNSTTQGGSWRMRNEATSHLKQLCSKRKIDMCPDDIATVVAKETTMLHELKEGGKYLNLEPGSFIAFGNQEAENKAGHRFSFVLWKGGHKIMRWLAKHEYKNLQDIFPSPAGASEKTDDDTTVNEKPMQDETNDSGTVEAGVVSEQA